MVVTMQNTQEKADLQKTKADAKKITEKNFIYTGKEWRLYAQ